MKRVSFGLKYEVSGLDEGTLKIKVKNNSKTFVDVSNVVNGCNSETKYFQFSNIQTPYNRTDNYYETVTVSVTHKHSLIEYEESLGSVDVKVYRNKVNNIRINLSTIMSAKGRDCNAAPRSIVSMEYEDIK